ncbi:P-type type IV conjugative transfer system translocation pore protein TrbG/VirB9 (plasmid) [Campylobacter novaezeelandiae]|uniref:P-type conjugative transfer protein VirB9 n=1 Tax=Campylobacter novaezeelandiae TaxID=2267891 RepID=UPI001C1E55DA|nr:P-type conjugative transfer protein VirB9 [Campylobacter novaezeelandiae]MBX1307071.1 P-type conjugative transfer protein VirB9 [Campylobacter jejuni]MBX1652187.1 P-type conjugative transfer protein VirB9 [Campylobacter jejuni]MBX1752308.1 P-type conjugative transfer protein VirB9 [Campylobacter jejuni]QWU80836.1 P-type type IV conjugative transfer system translocation pore protein TrbG/VirB9 [Campylobacter novaezeelandiae]
MKKIILISLFLNTFIWALSIPKTSIFDKRIAYAVYNANDVFQVNAKNGYVSVLEFGLDERIINTATGFAQGWDLIEKDNLLFIKPKAYKTQLVQQDSNNIGENQTSQEFVVDPNPSDWKTNLIVITNLNTYVFDLKLVTKNSNTTYKLSFSYPQKELKTAKEFLEAQEQENIRTDLNKNTIPRNWDFYMKVNKGSEDISPNFAYDDGVFTYLGFDNTKTFPAVFMYENGKESILNTHIKKDGNYDVLVIQKIAKQILLRSGDKVVGIFNRGYAKNPLRKTRETSNENIQREINKKK